MKRFLAYLLRWQLSTPILWLVVRQLGAGLWQTVVANLIGGAIFYWVDKFIFTSKYFEVWHYKENGKCDSCGKETLVRRLVKTQNYDRTNAHPIYLCKDCSDKKLEELKKRGVKVKGI
ncbi:MAG: hypothetical protein SNJ64_01055 [Endomicrobiia bacterium]